LVSYQTVRINVAEAFINRLLQLLASSAVMRYRQK